MSNKPTVYVMNGVDKWELWDGSKHKDGNFDAVFVTEIVHGNPIFKKDPDNPYGIIGSAGELINLDPSAEITTPNKQGDV